MAKIILKAPNTPYQTTLDTNGMDVEIREAYIGVRLVSDSGKVLHVSMRDGGFEVSGDAIDRKDQSYLEL